MKMVENFQCFMTKMSIEFKCEVIKLNLYYYDSDSFTKPSLESLFWVMYASEFQKSSNPLLYVKYYYVIPDHQKILLFSLINVLSCLVKT